jgi:hypothetical protein
MGRLSELAERCERATGPDRGLDADIELAIGNWTPEHHEAWNRFQECGEAVNPPMAQPVDPHWFTTSIDAAMQLVPEGCRLASFGQHRDGWWEAIIVTPAPGDDGYAKGKASEGALALVAASLRARSSKIGGGNA